MQDSHNEQARAWGMWCHLASLAWLPLALLSLIGIPPLPFSNILAPLVIWLGKKNEHPFIDEQGKESLNFQISFTIYGILLGVIIFVLLLIFALVLGVNASGASGDAGGIAALLGFGFLGIFLILGLIISIIQLGLVIFAAIKARKGESYRYPLTIRFLK
jgi:uncharacterized protein